MTPPDQRMPDRDAPDQPESTGGMRSDNSPTPGVFPASESLRPTLIGDHYMIAAGHPLVAHACAAILEQGGTAIDAGVAGGLACNVVQADMCNLGGIAPIVLRQAGEAQVWAISGVGTWGRAATIEAFRDRYGDDMPLGVGVGVVPAGADAWLVALERFGTKGLAEVAEPAIQFADAGFPLDLRTASAYGILGRTFQQWPSSAAVYWPNGRPPDVGERLRQPALARTLSRLVEAEQGDDRDSAIAAARSAFYKGAIGREIAAWCQTHGGWLDDQDLASFTSTVEPAPFVAYRGHRVFTPPAYTQGPIMLMALKLLQRFDLASLGHNSADTLHLIVEALKLAFAERERAMADPLFAAEPLDALLSDSHIDDLARSIDHAVAMPDPHEATVRPARPKADTTYLCVIDADGNAFSAMPSDTIDGGPVIPDLGIIVSPRGVQSSNRPGHPNALAPGKRPRITPAPALSLGPGDDPRVLAFGCPGGDVIIQAMLQAFVNVVDFGMTFQQAVEAPRLASFCFPGSFFPNPHFPQRVDVEARITPDVRAELASRGHALSDWSEWEFDAGGTAMVGDVADPRADGRVLGAGADPRRTTYAWGR